MSLIAPPEWFKDAVDNWPTAYFRSFLSGQSRIASGSNVTVTSSLPLYSGAPVNLQYRDLDTDFVIRKNRTTITPRGEYGAFLREPAPTDDYLFSGLALPNMEDGIDDVMIIVGAAAVQPLGAEPIFFSRTYGELDLSFLTGQTVVAITPTSAIENDLTFFKRPQYRAATLAFKKTGADSCVVAQGQAHPEYVKNIPYLNKVQEVTMATSVSKAIHHLGVFFDNVGSFGITFIEVKSPHATPISFDFSGVEESDAEGVSWDLRTKGLKQTASGVEVVGGSRLLDYRGFPLSD